MMRQAVPLQPMEVINSGADIHLQPVEDPTLEQVEAPEGGCDPVGSPRCSRLLAGPVALWREEPMPGQLSSPMYSHVYGVKCYGHKMHLLFPTETYFTGLGPDIEMAIYQQTE
ncbi:AN1-type zinc finger protein 5-like [Grus japonensis]|uniref:AN1-type zinc finger protein 5-like n=1 Tax=Grus japonensis TaxID=30415 RepID=A0ABC9WE03_GRUJA